MFNRIKQLFEPKQVTVPISKAWRQGMWVMCNDKPAILFKLGEPCIVHFVDSQTGETVEAKEVSVYALRQCRYDEIPECRRMISKERAEELGYAT